MKIHSYVMSRDYGFAPNPFFNYCTLATCKPVIRRCAEIGDWVLGTGSVNEGLEGRLIYAMRVGEALTFDAYWSDPRFLPKRPKLNGSLKQAFGDNIYHHVRPGGVWRQENSHHSRHGGCTNPANVRHDTKTDRVLVSDWFVYFGRDAIEIPQRFRGENEICGKRFHRVLSDPGLMLDVIDWIRSLHGEGLQGEPMLFDRQLAPKKTHRLRAR